MSEWASSNVIMRCRRCSRAVKVRRVDMRRLVFCSRPCEDWHVEEIRMGQLDRQNARIAMRAWARWEQLAKTPLHELYPGMLGVIDWAQRQRPSYAAWAGLVPVEQEGVYV